jgi:alginate O-acetyltransferase complex protein AlgI
LKNAVILAGSLVFYAWGAHSFILIVIATSIIDYQLGKIIYKTRSEKTRLYQACIIIDLIINFGLLLYFKYTNFLLDNINNLFQIMGLNLFTFTRIVLPIGISFVVFQKVTYCLDIAKGTTAPAMAYWCFLEYLLIFPQIIAGPIVKYNDIAAQIAERTWSHKNIIEGFKRFAIGLFKKVWIADVLAKYADIAFNGPSNLIPIHYAWFGMICYTFQIYFDFSSYSDMAIGFLKVMRFTISENFNFPYVSKSITEFWKRWHISLTSWMREYLYIPLGGNRKGRMRTYFNQWIVFLSNSHFSRQAPRHLLPAQKT